MYPGSQSGGPHLCRAEQWGAGAAGSSPWPKAGVLWKYRWVDMSQEGGGLQGKFKGN